MRPILSIMAWLLTFATVTAQNSQERHFVQISHSSGHTVAVDSSGQKWFYDSESGDFVTEDEYDGHIQTSREPSQEDDLGPDDIILPPEIRCTEVRKGDITEFFSQVVVGSDERIEGSITSGRDVIVNGLVTGNIISFRTVTVTSGGEVRGDVFAREIIRERGGRILGQRKEVPLPEAFGIGVPKVPGLLPDFMGVIFTGFLIFICVITIALFPRQLGRIVGKIEGGAVKSFFWGVLGWFATLPVFVLLVITIVGIPIAFLVFPFVLIAAVLLGYVAVTVFIGDKLSPLFGWQDKSIYVKSIMGVVFIAALRLVGNFFISLGVEGLGILLSALYLIIALAAVTVGFGAVISSRFGARPKTAGQVSGSGSTPVERAPAPPIKPPPPKTGPLPPPPVPPPALGSKKATGAGDNPSNQ